MSIFFCHVCCVTVHRPTLGSHPFRPIMTTPAPLPAVASPQVAAVDGGGGWSCNLDWPTLPLNWIIEAFSRDCAISLCLRVLVVQTVGLLLRATDCVWRAQGFNTAPVSPSGSMALTVSNGSWSYLKKAIESESSSTPIWCYFYSVYLVQSPVNLELCCVCPSQTQRRPLTTYTQNSQILEMCNYSPLTLTWNHVFIIQLACVVGLLSTQFD